MDRSWPTVGRVGVAALITALVLSVVPLLASDARAAGRPWSSTTSAFVDSCAVDDATPQICDPAHVHEVRVPRGKRIHVTRLRYTAADTHCSSGRLRIALNGTAIGRTDWVAAGEESTVELLDVTLRRRKGGKAHRFTYRMEGQLGGCNVGAVGSWAGDIKLSGKKKPA